MLLLECLLGLIRFLLGAALFSFMNVVAWRLPRDMDPLKGRSVCPQCGQEQVHKVYAAPSIEFKGSGFYRTDRGSSK